MSEKQELTEILGTLRRWLGMGTAMDIASHRGGQARSAINKAISAKKKEDILGYLEAAKNAIIAGIREVGQSR